MEDDPSISPPPIDPLIITRRIRPLAAEVVQKIAAGEVIHLPVNAVKELIENALDAGSTHIIIVVKDGGYKEIMIRDNGCGIHPDDADVIANRFHSSKIRSVNDVYNIQTFGFRGEALSSMAVSGKLTIVSRKADSDVGVRIVVSGGTRTHTPEHGLDPGTTMVVTDLFQTYSPSEVKASVYRLTSLVSRYSMANIGIKFILNTPSAAFKSPRIETTEKAIWIAAVLGVPKVFEEHISSKHPSFKAEIYGTPLREIKPNTRSSKLNFTCFVNKRLVTVVALEALIKSHLERGVLTCDSVVAFLTVDPSMLDVHVSPTKEFVTLRNSESVMEVISESFGKVIDERLENAPQPKPTKSTSNLNFFASQRATTAPSQKQRFDPNQSLMDSFLDDSGAMTQEQMDDEADAVENGFEKLDVASQETTNGAEADSSFIDPDADSDIVKARRILTNLTPALLESLEAETDAIWLEKLRDAVEVKLEVRGDGQWLMLLNHDSHFIFVLFDAVLQDYFKQKIIRNIGNLPFRELQNQELTISIRDVITGIASDAPEEFIAHKLRIIKASADGLKQYFNVEVFQSDENMVVEDVFLVAAPQLHTGQSVPWSNIATVLATIPTPITAENTVYWIQDVANRLAGAYVAELHYAVYDPNSQDEAVARWTRFLPTFKSTYLPGAVMRENSFSYPNAKMYAVFERC
uniref:DNA_mis_repair domain-containing protein n=1 Tax=Panagrellus redivivus TaxID=6233 RepID=A0A7E4VZK6_PANRE